MGNDTYFVHVDDAVEVQAELQNMRLRVDNQDPIDATVGDELPIHPYHVMAWKYDYDIGRGLKFVVYSMEAMMHHMLIVPMVGALAHYTYIPTGKEQQDKHGGEGYATPKLPFLDSKSRRQNTCFSKDTTTTTWKNNTMAWA
ncbi:unnamed protein product [Lactuca saligna]|uniref:Uncharacterized protein n=1 Tax=Lactuca saligna TaxID=75948 RepID=A0AA36E2H4_LACSI|nr:unnamed protein product [Lactuca saligna]